MFVAELTEQNPLLPVEEEGRLNQSQLSANFFDRVFAHHRLQEFFASEWSVDTLVSFHTREKILVSAHDEQRYCALGYLVATSKRHKPSKLAREYVELFMTTLHQRASLLRHCNTLQHMIAFFRPHFTDKQRHDLLKSSGDYHNGLAPLAVPLTLFKCYADSLEIDCLK